MTDKTDDTTVDFDAIDAEVARGRANGADKAADPAVVVADPAAATDETPPRKVLTPEVGIEKVQKQLDEERARRIAAENHAADLANAEAEARTKVQQSDLDLVKGAIDRVKQSDDALEKQYAEAFAAQDGVALAKIQRQMATNAAQLAQLEAGKNALEKAPKPAPRAAADPVEAYVARIGPQYPRSQAWVRAHPEYATDKRKEQRMLAAHNLAVASDLAPDSDEYFKSIEKSLGIETTAQTSVVDADTGADPMADAAQPAAAAPARRANGSTTPPAAAPVTRTGGSTRKGTITLTPAQVEAAEISGLTVEEYAKQVLATRN
jgi:hypothetical protein